MSRSKNDPAEKAQLVPVTDEQIAAAEREIVEHSKRIEFYLTEYTVELLASKMDSGDFEIQGVLTI